MMKRFLSLILCLLLCLFSTACNASEQTDTANSDVANSKTDSATESTTESITEDLGPDYREIVINNIWMPLNCHYEFPMEYHENGRCLTYGGSAFTWELDGDRLTLSPEEESTWLCSEYTIVEADGVYFLCSDKMTYVMIDANDAYEVETVEITLDNIGNYFEVVTGSVYEYFDDFGEKIGERIYDYYTLKPEYVHALVDEKSKLIVRRIERIYENDEAEYTSECGAFGVKATQQAGYGFSLYGELVEVTKVEGTLTFVAALLD